jgi:hypothetical protein
METVTVCKRYRKAVVGFLSAVVPLLAALVSSHVLNGDVSDWISKGLVAATPVLTLLGVAVAPKNAEFATQTADTLSATAKAVQALVAEYNAVDAAFHGTSEATPTVTTPPAAV